LVQGLERI